MKNFLIGYSPNHKLWSSFEKWLKEEYKVDFSVLSFQETSLVGIYNKCFVSIYDKITNHTSIPVITLEEWDEIVNGFVLPEKWCIKVTEESRNFLTRWVLMQPTFDRKYLPIKWWVVSENNVDDSYQKWSSKTNSSYTEITLKQFRKYVLKEKIDKRVYTIEDLSEGRVAVINDGTIEELTTVFKAAFPDNETTPSRIFKHYSRRQGVPKEWDAILNDAMLTKLPAQSVKEFINQLKTENMDNRFPFKLTVNQAQSIIDIACAKWKETLAELWAKQMLVDKVVIIQEKFYKEMREACTPEQNKLFDDIFGSDEEQFSVGDWVVVEKYISQDNLGKTYYKIGKVFQISKILDSNNTKIKKWIHGEPGKQISINSLRKATPEEIAKAQCPYEDGELCWVKDNEMWYLRYATGKVSKGCPTFYSNQEKTGYENTFKHHKSAKGVKLPKD